jgi:hypothetical protein
MDGCKGASSPCSARLAFPPTFHNSYGAIVSPNFPLVDVFIPRGYQSVTFAI